MKKVLSVLLIVMSLFALVGCGGKTENLQKEVDALKQSLAELQATVSTQSEQIGTLQGEKTTQAEKIAELEAAKTAQAETIAALQNSANLSAEEIAALEAQLAEQESILDELLPKGAFCSLQTAYANGWLLDDYYYQFTDHMQTIMNNYNKKNTETEVSQKVRNPQNIDAITLYAIKQTYLETEKKTSPNSRRTINDLSFGEFFDKCGKYIVLHLSDNSQLIPGTPIIEHYHRDEKIGNYLFKNYCELCIYVWYPIEE